MRIDGKSPMDASAMLDLSKTSPQNAKPLQRNDLESTGDSPCEVESLYLSYIQKLSACPEVDAGRVAQARDLIASNQLDTPQAARQAVENIVDSGI